jgi:hypothetical protein
VFVAYFGHGRFDVPRDAPVLDLRHEDADLADPLAEPVHGPPAAAHRFPVPAADMTNPLPAAITAPRSTPSLSTPALLQFPSSGTLTEPAME